MRLNKLKLNSDKYKLLVICSRYLPPPLVNFKVNNDQCVRASVSARSLDMYGRSTTGFII